MPHRYPFWSAKAALLISLPVVATLALLVFVLSDRSVFVELQMTLFLISLCLFAFLTTGLYSGVRLERPDKQELARELARFDYTETETGPRWLDKMGSVLYRVAPDLFHKLFPNADEPDIPDSNVNVVGCLVTMVEWITMFVLFVFLMWLLAQFVAAIPIVLLALYWVFYRALRVVFAKSRSCKGRLRRSMGYGLLYTVAYVGWIFAVLWMGGLLYVGLDRLAH